MRRDHGDKHPAHYGIRVRVPKPLRLASRAQRGHRTVDLATLLGILGGLGVIIAAILMGGSAPLFVNMPSIMIVCGGTFAVTLTRVSFKHFVGSFKIGIKAFMHKNHLALEGRDIGHPFLKQGIDLCIDGHPPETVTAMLEREIDLNIERQDVGIKMFMAI